MTRKQALLLFDYCDTHTIEDIVNIERNIKVNTYYDIKTKEALIYPEDEDESIPIRPLRTRFLKNGVRIDSQVSKTLENIVLDILKDEKEGIDD